MWPNKQGHSNAAAHLPLLFFFLVLGIFLCKQRYNLIQNQPIHEQLLLYCLVKWKYSRGFVDKKESKAILEKVCWPRRYIFPHKLGLHHKRAAPGIYTGWHITRRFPGISDQSGNRNKCRVCTRVTQWAVILAQRVCVMIDTHHSGRCSRPTKQQQFSYDD